MEAKSTEERIEKSKKRKTELGGEVVLSFEQYQEIGRKVREAEEERRESEKKWHNDYLRSIGVDPDKQKHIQPKVDSIYSLENGSATALYIIVMVASLIFNQFWIIWLAATIIYFKFITRHEGE